MIRCDNISGVIVLNEILLLLQGAGEHVPVQMALTTAHRREAGAAASF